MRSNRSVFDAECMVLEYASFLSWWGGIDDDDDDDDDVDVSCSRSSAWSRLTIRCSSPALPAALWTT